MRRGELLRVLGGELRAPIAWARREPEARECEARERAGDGGKGGVISGAERRVVKLRERSVREWRSRGRWRRTFTRVCVQAPSRRTRVTGPAETTDARRKDASTDVFMMFVVCYGESVNDKGGREEEKVGKKGKRTGDEDE
jgi:hypothetical protein